MTILQGTRRYRLAASSLPTNPESDEQQGLELLARSGDPSERQGNSQWSMRFVITETAKERARLGDLEGATALGRDTVEFLFASGDAITRGPAVSVLVESLLRRGTEADIAEAEAAIGRLAAVPTDPGFVLYELPLLRLRALLARTHGDENSYRDDRDRYSCVTAFSAIRSADRRRIHRLGDCAHSRQASGLGKRLARRQRLPSALTP